MKDKMTRKSKPEVRRRESLVVVGVPTCPLEGEVDRCEMARVVDELMELVDGAEVHMFIHSPGVKKWKETRDILLERIKDEKG